MSRREVVTAFAVSVFSGGSALTFLLLFVWPRLALNIIVVWPVLPPLFVLGMVAWKIAEARRRKKEANRL
jgi:hypothetical protein